ncbi:MAG: ERCC4 domain-containing protein [Halobacteria archaeon]
MQKVKAKIDIHEPENLTAQIDRHDEVEEYMLTSLDAGDIVIENIGFERKTPSDYASSLQSGRLRRQIRKMTEEFDAAYILIDGTMPDTLTHSGMKSKALRGSMASVMAREGISVIPCTNLSLLADMSVRLARKHIEEPSSSHLQKGSVEEEAPAGKQMWGCLPGVGPERAGKLYEAFGSPVQFAKRNQESVDMLQEVEGIGKKTAEQITEEYLK